MVLRVGDGDPSFPVHPSVEFEEIGLYGLGNIYLGS